MLYCDMISNRIKTISLQEQLHYIMNTLGFSVDEIAQLSGVSRTTIYRIMDGSNGYVQRSVVRKIAEGLNLGFNFDNDRVQLYIKKSESSEERRKITDKIVELYNELAEEDQKVIMKMMQSLVEHEGRERDSVKIETKNKGNSE